MGNAYGLERLFLQVGEADGKLEKTMEIHPSKNISHDFCRIQRRRFELSCKTKYSFWNQPLVPPSEDNGVIFEVAPKLSI